MNIYSKITLKALEKNKARTIVTIIGIILSAALITAVTTSISSLRNYILRVSIYDSGDYHSCLYYTSPEALEEAKKDPDITSIATAQNIGFAKIDSQNKLKPYMYVLGADENFLKTMPVHLTEGRLPTNAGEIILPKHLESNGYLKIEVGSKITLEIGNRKTVFEGDISAEDAELMSSTVLTNIVPLTSTITDSFMVTETVEPELTRTYTVVGKYARPEFENYSAPGYTAITTTDTTLPEAKLDVYIKLDTSKLKGIYTKTELLKTQLNALGYRENSDLLMLYGVSGYAVFMRILYGFGAILIGLMMFGSVSLIYNAFAISVSERTKQFGLLSSIGATKKQLKKSVISEAFFVSVIGIPAGILVGIAGIGITLFFVGDKFTSLYNGGADIPFSLSVSIPSVVIAAIIAFVTVLISAWIPSRRATKISAIDAIRQSTDIKLPKRNPKTPKYVYKLFGLEGMLADKHFKRNKRNYRATVLSLFMSIVLFVSSSSFCSYLTLGAEGTYDTYSDVVFSYEHAFDDEIMEIFSGMSDIKYVKSAVAAINFNGKIEVARENLDSSYAKLFDASMESTEVYAALCVMDDENFRSFLAENGLDSSDYFDTDTLHALVNPKISYRDYEEQKTQNYTVLRSLPNEAVLKMNTYKYDVEGKSGRMFFGDLPVKTTIVESIPDGFSKITSSVRFFIPYSMAKKLSDGGDETMRLLLNDPDSYSMFAFRTDEDELLADELFNYVKTVEMKGVYSVQNMASNQRSIRNLIVLIKVFSYGFITLVSLIAAANVFNTITTSISLRRKEFAMLKSVGMKNTGILKMMNYECILYGLKALLYGIPVSCVITYAIFNVVNEGWSTEYFIPAGAIIVAVLSVFAVVFASMLFAINKIIKDNPIDALKNENF